MEYVFIIYWYNTKQSVNSQFINSILYSDEKRKEIFIDKGLKLFTKYKLDTETGYCSTCFNFEVESFPILT